MKTDPDTTTRDPAGLRYTSAEIRELAQVLKEFDLASLEVRSGEHQVHLVRHLAQPAAAPLAAAPLVPVPPADNDDAEPDDGTTLITSPFVGTFYRASSPEADPFVEVGHAVQKGQVLCIVEAMKLMNEIEADDGCQIVEIICKNSAPVEFGQPLFRVKPLG